MGKKNVNNFWTLSPILTKFDIQHQLYTRNKRFNRKSWNLENKMAAGRHIGFHKNLNNFRTVSPIITKFGTELRPDTAETPEVSKMSLFKIQDGRRRNRKYV